VRYWLPYSKYAQVYDLIGQRAFGERMAGVILELLSKRHVFPTTVLDLGCGTGAATVAFARAGLQATGVDRSPQMLERARWFAQDSGVNIELVEADLTELKLDARFDLVTSIYDTVNYLEGESEFMQFIRGAYRALHEEGFLVFDLNTRHRLMSSWEQGLMLAGDSDDLYVTYRSWYDERLDASPLVLTAFVREKHDCWSRFDEEHIERSWPIAQVREWLGEAGYRVLEVAGYIDSTGDLISPASEDHGRVVFVAAR
jgi:ubiquinone/menaquinone biosynthesis C-methylase UbiE